MLTRQWRSQKFIFEGAKQKINFFFIYKNYIPFMLIVSNGNVNAIQYIS